MKKPLICQAGSAETFAGSPATGREHHNYTAYRTSVKLKVDVSGYFI